MSMANYGKLWFDGTLQETWQLHVSTIDFDPYPFMAFQLDTEYQILNNGENLNISCPFFDYLFNTFGGRQINALEAC